MKNFLAVYIGTPEALKKSGWESLSDASRQEKTEAGIKGWHSWMEANRSSIVDTGSPLGKTKSTSKQGVSDIKNSLSGYTIVRADSHEAAARLFENHPHFMLFPGDSVEIMECLPIPGM